MPQYKLPAGKLGAKSVWRPLDRKMVLVKIIVVRAGTILKKGLP
jgi:hypothetical protein